MNERKKGKIPMITDPLITTESFAHMIYKYGPAIVLMSVFLMLFIVVMFFMLKQQQKTNDKMVDEHRELLQFLIKSKKEEQEGDLSQINKVYDKARTHLKLILGESTAKLNSKRIGIYLLHNGTNSLTMFPFLKFSCITEHLAKPPFSKIKQHHNFPVDLMSEFIIKLTKNTYICKDKDEDTVDINDPMFLKLIHESDRYIVHAILSSDSILIGFILAEFEITELVTTNATQSIKYIGDMAKKVAPIIEFSDYNNVYKAV